MVSGLSAALERQTASAQALESEAALRENRIAELASEGESLTQRLRDVEHVLAQDRAQQLHLQTQLAEKSREEALLRAALDIALVKKDLRLPGASLHTQPLLPTSSLLRPPLAQPVRALPTPVPATPAQSPVTHASQPHRPTLSGVNPDARGEHGGNRLQESSPWPVARSQWQLSPSSEARPPSIGRAVQLLEVERARAAQDITSLDAEISELQQSLRVLVTSQR